jgi:dihydrofolate reductase
MAENARTDAALVFGRVTFDQMASFWPTPAGHAANPVVAERMTRVPKIVFSRTPREPSWANTTVLGGDVAAEVRRLKAAPGPDLVILGSGSIVAQLAEAGLVDEYQIVVNPVVLGRGRTLFEGVTHRVPLTLKRSRSFSNGNVVSWYEPAGSQREAQP